MRVLEEEEEETRRSLGVNRSEWGLPEEAVVLACFNTLIKLRPAMLRSWIRILRRAPRRYLKDSYTSSLSPRTGILRTHTELDPHPPPRAAQRCLAPASA